MAADRRREEVKAGESWKRAQQPPKGGNYDRGAEQARAFSEVLNRWNPLLTDGKQEWREPSNSEVAGLIGRHLGRTYWPNDVDRAYKGDLRMHHLKPKVVEAFCIALGHTDEESMAEAFAAIELKPPEVTRDALKLAIATSRSGSGRLSA